MLYKKWLLVILAFFLAFFIGFVIRTQVLPRYFYAELKFKEYTHDFGAIKRDIPVETWFVFKNTGNKSLIIKDILTSCDCTTFQFPQYSINPGEKDSIRVVFDATKRNFFKQQIYVYSNATKTPVALYIVGDCVESE